MPPCAQAVAKTIIALAAAATFAPAAMAAAPDAAALPLRLEQHTQMLSAARGAGAPAQAARYIETALASQGHAVSRHDYARQGLSMRRVEVSIANPAAGRAPDRVLVVGASHASATRGNDSATAVVIELARRLRGLRPAEGTELKFVFFVSAAAADTGNFIAFAGTRAAAKPVRKTLASLRAAPATEGLAARAFEEGVTLLADASRGRHGEPALVITDVAFLHYPYAHTAQAETDKPDYAGMARGVDSLAKLVAGMAAPATM